MQMLFTGEASPEFNPDTLKTLFKFQNCLEISTDTENSQKAPSAHPKIINMLPDDDSKLFKMDNKK